MESLSLLLENPTYFSENTPSNIKKEFIKNMYLTIIPNAFIIYSSLQLTNYGLLNLFFDSGFSSEFLLSFFMPFLSQLLYYIVILIK